MTELVPGDLVLLRRKQGIELFMITVGPSASDPLWFRAASTDGKTRRFPTSLLVHGPFSRLEPAREIDSDAIATAHRRLLRRSETLELTVLHECTLTEPRAYALDELAELLFDDAVGEERAALFVALSSDSSPFEETETGYVPSSLEDLAARRREREREEAEREERTRRASAARAEKRLQRETLGPELKRLATNRIGPSELSDLTREWLAGLRAFIIENAPSGNGDLAYGSDLLRIRDESHAVQLLARAGLWDPDREDVLALRSEIGRSRPDALELEAETLVPDDAPAEDLTALPTFTVDGPSTRDLDDALSLTCVDGGVRVHVHIADVARWLPIGSGLDVWGRDNGESVYLPEGVHHLYPDPLIRHTSLDPARERFAVSLEALVTSGGDVLETRFARTRICSDERLDYAELDRRIAEDPQWATRAQLVDWLQARRRQRGATITLLPDLEVSIDGSSLETRVVATDTPSHRLVAELMILFNEQLGHFFAGRGVPAIYKTQPADETPPDFPEADDPLYFPRIVRLLRPSRSGLDPALHAFIGVEAYSQGTSPIRRYQDLVHQRQLVAVLAGGTPPYSHEDLATLYPLLEQRGTDGRRVERRRRRYWVLKRLSQLRGSRLRGIVSQIRPGGRPVVFFPDFLMETGLLLPPDFTVEIGDEIYVTPQKVDPIRGGVWAQPAG